MQHESGSEQWPQRRGGIRYAKKHRDRNAEDLFHRNRHLAFGQGQGQSQGSAESAWLTFVVRYSASARDDLKRLDEHRLDRATTVEALDWAERAFSTLIGSVDNLGSSPFIYRKASPSPFLRELLIPFGNSGHVALFEIEDASPVTILALRHLLEDDHH